MSLRIFLNDFHSLNTPLLVTDVANLGSLLALKTSPETIVTCSNAGRFQEADVLTSRGKERSVSY